MATTPVQRGWGVFWNRNLHPPFSCWTMWQSGLMRVTRNHVLSGAQVRTLASSTFFSPDTPFPMPPHTQPHAALSDPRKTCSTLFRDTSNIATE